MTKRIMVFEDDVSIQRLVKMILVASGFEVLLCDTPLSGIEQLKNGDSVDMILLDIIMPEIDGLRVLKELKVHPHTKNVPVMIMTSLTHHDVVKHGIRLGAIDYLRKPFHPQSLTERMQKHLMSSAS